jgi:hypothetical protein
VGETNATVGAGSAVLKTPKRLPQRMDTPHQQVGCIKPYKTFRVSSCMQVTLMRTFRRGMCRMRQE